MHIKLDMFFVKEKCKSAETFGYQLRTKFVGVKF